MIKRWNSKDADSSWIISPWETIPQKEQNSYCFTADKLFKSSQRNKKVLPSINYKRVQSQCSNENRVKKIQAFSCSKKNSNILQKLEKFKIERPALQEVSVKNFIIEGGKQRAECETGVKKKQSSYIMKQKFAQIRRSMSISNKQTNNFKVIRYER